MSSDDDMPCGECSACGDYVDHSRAGFCGTCGSAFHWPRCGGWVGGKHKCNACQEGDGDEDA